MFLDIETIPVEKEKHEVVREIYGRSLDDGKKVGTFEEYIALTSFDGAFGRIVCLGWAIDDGPTNSVFGSEKEIIEKFWEIAEKAEQFIGFNLMDFDLRFIYQRSIILGIKPSKFLSFARYRSYPIYDICCEWTMWAYLKKGTLHELSVALGLNSSKTGEIEGKNVAKAYEDGRIKEICEYCEKDVEVTRQIYYRMTFYNPT